MSAGRRPLVDLGAGEVALAAQLGGHAVRRVGRVGGHVGAVDRRDAGQPVGEGRRRPHHERAAHAVAHRADAPGIGLRLRVDEGQHRLRVAPVVARSSVAIRPNMCGHLASVRSFSQKSRVRR
jgi:hypothetical protein